MSRKPRMFVPGGYYLITGRTVQGCYIMRPTRRVTDLMGGVIAKAQVRLPEVKIYNLVFLSNHYHIILSGPPADISQFMEFIGSNIAREVGRAVGWRDKFWAHRFKAQKILDEEAFDRLMAYMWAHGAKEGLVDEGKLWPGLQCIGELMTGVQRSFPWVDRTAQYFASLGRRKRLDDSAFTTFYPLRLSILPHLAGLDEARVRKVYRDIYQEACQLAEDKREGKASLGVEAVLAQDPHDSPKHFKRKPQPLCHSSCSRERTAYAESYRSFVEDFHKASARFRRGLPAVFPDHAFRPPLPFDWALSARASPHPQS